MQHKRVNVYPPELQVFMLSIAEEMRHRNERGYTKIMAKRVREEFPDFDHMTPKIASAFLHNAKVKGLWDGNRITIPAHVTGSLRPVVDALKNGNGNGNGLSPVDNHMNTHEENKKAHLASLPPDLRSFVFEYMGKIKEETPYVRPVAILDQMTERFPGILFPASVKLLKEWEVWKESKLNEEVAMRKVSPGNFKVIVVGPKTNIEREVSCGDANAVLGILFPKVITN